MKIHVLKIEKFDFLKNNLLILRCLKSVSETLVNKTHKTTPTT